MKKRMYLFLQFKRALKIYPTVFIVTFMTLASIAAAAFWVINNNLKSEDKQKVSIGITGNTTDTFFNMGINVIKSIDSSKNYIDFISMSEEEAKKALENDEIFGYIFIPDGFVDGIAFLKNKAAKYYFPNKPESLGTILTQEVIDTVSVYITESQRAAEGLRNYIAENNLKKGSAIDDISQKMLMSILFARNGYYKSEFTGVADSLSTGAYYTVGFITFFLLLWGISCSRLMMKNNCDFYKILRIRGIKSVAQIICEYIVYFVITLVTFIFAAAVFGIIAQNVRIPIAELEFAGSWKCVCFVLRIIPAILAVTAMQTALYEAVFGTVPSLLSQFLCAIVLGYLSGCFYPNYFFPQAVRTVIEFLPSGAAFSSMRKAVAGEFDVGSFLTLTAYTVVFIAAAILIRKKRTDGDC